MGTRYEQLRESIAALAASPETQTTILDRLFAPLTDGDSAIAYGNVELIEQFGDIYAAHVDMAECGELRPNEVEAVARLDQLVDRICAEQDDALWQREALFTDERWGKLRHCASGVLAQLPAEARHSDYTPRSNGS
jgi:hypothetical protein